MLIVRVLKSMAVADYANWRRLYNKLLFKDQCKFDASASSLSKKIKLAGMILRALCLKEGN